MSAKAIVGMEPSTAAELDAFWNSLSPEHRATLHTAYNLSEHRAHCVASLRDPAEILRNAESGRTSVSSVRGEFVRFLERNIAANKTAGHMLIAILDYGQMTAEEQDTVCNGV